MNIAMFLLGFPSVSETFMIRQLENLVERGAKPWVFPTRVGDLDASAHPALPALLSHTHYPAQPRTRIGQAAELLRVTSSSAVQHPIATIRALALASQKHGVSVQEVATALPKLLHQPPDILHAQFGPSGLRALCLKQALSLDAPVITTFHGFDVHTIPRILGEDIYDELFEVGDWFTVGTIFMKEQIMALGAPEERISVIPMSTPVHQFPFRKRKAPDQGPIRLLTVARLTKVKGHHIALKALHSAKDELPDFHYHIVGDGEQREELESLVDTLQLDTDITFHGALSGDSVIDQYQAADVFLMPGIVTEGGRAEGQGVVLGEAQACGVPILTTDAGGCKYAVIPGESAVVVEHSNINAYAKGLRDLLCNPGQWGEMGVAGRQLVEGRFSADAVGDQFYALYEKLSRT